MVIKTPFILLNGEIILVMNIKFFNIKIDFNTWLYGIYGKV